MTVCQGHLRAFRLENVRCVVAAVTTEKIDSGRTPSPNYFWSSSTHFSPRSFTNGPANHPLQLLIHLVNLFIAHREETAVKTGMFRMEESCERDLNGSSGGVSLVTSNPTGSIASFVSHLPPTSKVSVAEGDMTSIDGSIVLSPSFSLMEPKSHGREEGSSSFLSIQRPESIFESRSLGEDASTGTRRTVSLDESGPAAKKFRVNDAQPQPSWMIVQGDHKEEATQHPIAATRKSSNILLLARPDDDMVLSPLHVFVRQQVEVFTATEADISQPAPGRKNRIQLNQVGLRCIHCRDLPPRDRVKRAVCYPSSVGRVYHSVSDMKFDHFSHCKGRSVEVKTKFDELKDDSKQKRHKKSLKTPVYSSSSTAQYYHDSAREMGMVDGPGGLFMIEDISNFNSSGAYHPSLASLESNSTQSQAGIPILPKPLQSVVLEQDAALTSNNLNHVMALGMDTRTSLASLSASLDQATKNAMMSSLASYLYSMNTTNHILNDIHEQRNRTAEVTSNAIAENLSIHTAGTCLLTSPLDQYHLNPLHCFVRRHIEVFVADKDDIAAPAPGRKTRVSLGQVGLRCIHCAALPMKDRVKRAVCYPAAVAGVYHSVSNMKFDHFDKCRGLPDHERAIFVTLRSTCGRHGPRNSSAESTGSKGVPNTNSTAQYYHDSAIAMGLVDSENGIRFQDPPLPGTGSVTINYKSSSTKPTKKYFSRSLLGNGRLSRESNSATDGISALMIAASVRVAAAAVAAEADPRPSPRSSTSSVRREEMV
jgi:hypothetical protein